MTVNERRLRQYCDSMRIFHMTKEQKNLILERFGSEPGDGHIWSEEDICEQVRKILNGKGPAS